MFLVNLTMSCRTKSPKHKQTKTITKSINKMYKQAKQKTKQNKTTQNKQSKGTRALLYSTFII